MMRRVVFAGLTTVALAAGVGVATARGDQPQPETTALLNEVRLLRVAIESMASTSARVQIVFGRLQLQEQRTTTALQRLDAAREALSAINRQVNAVEEVVKKLEAAVASGRQQDEVELEGMRREAARLEVERTRLSSAEGEAAALLAQEQGRWAELNQRLEELERAMTPRR